MIGIIAEIYDVFEDQRGNVPLKKLFSYWRFMICFKITYTVLNPHIKGLNLTI